MLTEEEAATTKKLWRTRRYSSLSRARPPCEKPIFVFRDITRIAARVYSIYGDRRMYRDISAPCMRAGRGETLVLIVCRCCATLQQQQQQPALGRAIGWFLPRAWMLFAPGTSLAGRERARASGPPHARSIHGVAARAEQSHKRRAIIGRGWRFLRITRGRAGRFAVPFIIIVHARSDELLRRGRKGYSRHVLGLHMSRIIDCAPVCGCLCTRAPREYARSAAGAVYTANVNYVAFYSTRRCSGAFLSLHCNFVYSSRVYHGGVLMLVTAINWLRWHTHKLSYVWLDEKFFEYQVQKGYFSWLSVIVKSHGFVRNVLVRYFMINRMNEKDSCAFSFE